uniref:Uncharacterized protein n=1 Tax=Xiphophorus couchianus TaxID=32473 RepID=A0A3B5M5W2_9TELE
MATYVDILKREFPEIDTELFDYITGVLDSGASDFEDGEEVFDAIGGVLQDVSADSKNEDDVRDIYPSMNNHHHPQKQMLLDAPVQLSQMSTVDAKKLEKAEAKLKAKNERRTERDTQKATGPVLEEASASQASNKKESRADQSGKNRSYDIRIENFDISFGERCLLQGAELSLASGRRYGLIGRNGLGKTTLLKMLASRNLRVPAHISILHVEQEVAGDDTIALQSVLESDTKREDLLNEERRACDCLRSTPNWRRSKPTRPRHGNYGNTLVAQRMVLERFFILSASYRPIRASVILAGLGFSPRMQQQPTK